MVLRIVLLWVATGATGLLAAGCGGETARPTPDTVVVTVYPLAWAAERVAPPGMTVIDLAPPAAEPHDFELSARDVEALLGAHLVVHLAGGFQPAVDDALAERTGNVFDARERSGVHEAPPGEDLPYDPHVWLDPLRLAKIAHGVAEALGTPAAADTLAMELEGLHWAFEEGLRVCERRTIVTSHAAFGYLAERFRLQQIGLAGLEPEADPDPETLARLVDVVRESGATTVFREPRSSSKVADVIAREAGVRVAVLDPVESLSADQRERGEDYLSVMRANLEVLREALGCT